MWLNARQRKLGKGRARSRGCFSAAQPSLTLTSKLNDGIRNALRTNKTSQPQRPYPQLRVRTSNIHLRATFFTMVHKILFWTGFGTSPSSKLISKDQFLTGMSQPGLAVNFWRLGIEMRPFFNRGSLWAYPLYGSIGASFGYWLMGVEERQQAVLTARRESLLEKRARRAEREAAEAS